MWIAERTLYLPSVGVSLLLVAALEQVRLHRGSRSLRALGGTIVILSALGGLALLAVFEGMAKQ